RVLMITSEDDALGAKYDSNYPKLRSKGIDIIHQGEIPKKYENFHFKVFALEQDMVMVRHPFVPNTYVELQESAKAIEDDKMRSFFEICQFLGIAEIQEEKELS